MKEWGATKKVGNTWIWVIKKGRFVGRVKLG